MLVVGATTTASAGDDAPAANPEDPAAAMAAAVASSGVTSVRVDDDGATIWRVSDGYDLDQYLFRGSSPLDFQLKLSIGEVFGPYDADGRPLPESPLYNEPFTLTVRAYDVDEDQGEVDKLSVNGEELVGGTLSGANNQWSINSFSVPGRMLKLYAPIPQVAVNDFAIEIDVNNDGWAVEIDWAELRFDGGGPLPVMLNHGITGGVDDNEDGCADTSEAPLDIVSEAYAEANDLQAQAAIDDQHLTCPVSSYNGTAEYNAVQLAEALDEQLEATGAKKVDIFAHSMGGLNSRVLAHTNTEQVRSIIMFGTPNAGSELSDDLCGYRGLWGGGRIEPQFGDCELPDDDGDLTNDDTGGLYQLRRSYVRDVFNPAYPDLSSVSYRVYGGYKGGWGSGKLNGQDDGTVELESVYWLRPEGTSVRFLGEQGPEHPGLHEPGDVVDNGHSQLWAADSDALPLATCYRWPTTCEDGESPSTTTAAALEAAAGEPTVEVVDVGVVDLAPGAEATVAIPAQDSTMLQQVMVLFDGEVSAAVNGVALDRVELFGEPVLAGGWAPTEVDAVLTITNTSSTAAAVANYAVWGDTAATLALDLPTFATAGDTVDVVVSSTVGDTVPISVSAVGTTGATLEQTVTPAGGTATVQLAGLTAGVYEVSAKTEGPYRSTSAFLTVVPGDVTLGSATTFSRLDENGNGLFDRVTAAVDVTVPATTDVRVVGQLASDTGAVALGGIGGATLTGTGSVDVVFDADRLYEFGHDGVWHLVNVLVIDDTTGRVLAQRPFAGASPYWPLSDWERDAVTFGTFTDKAVDLDGDGQLDQLTVDGMLDVLEPASYAINVRLTTRAGQELGEYQTVRSLARGQSPVQFTFPGRPIGEAGVDGPYVVADLSVYPTSRPSQLAYATVAHTTAPYLACDFVGAECVVTFEAYREALVAASDAGELTSNGVLRSLVAKVDTAQSAYDRGDVDATAGALGALENELTNIGESRVSEEARVLLLDLLDQLTASL